MNHLVTPLALLFEIYEQAQESRITRLSDIIIHMAFSL